MGTGVVDRSQCVSELWQARAMQRAPTSNSIVVVLAMCGCGDAAQPKAQTQTKVESKIETKAEPAAAIKCPADHEAELTRALVAGCDMPLFGEYTRVDVRKLARASWETKPRDAIDGVSIVLTAEGVLENGTAEPWDPQSAAALLRERATARREREPSWSPRFVAVIHGDVKLATVQELLAALAEASLTTGTIVLASGTLPPTPGALYPELFARLGADLEGDLSTRATKLAQGLEDDIVGCPALVQVFTDVATRDPKDRCKTMMPAVAKAIVSCDCPAWEPAVVTRLQLMDDRTAAPQVHAEDVELAKDRATKVDGTQTWATFVASRTSPLGALWLDV